MGRAAKLQSLFETAMTDFTEQLQSCKLNNVDFGYYIEDILTRIVNGEEIDESFIPCNYVARPLKEESVA